MDFFSGPPMQNHSGVDSPPGMPAGEIADAVGTSATNTSFHLKELEATQHGRYTRHAVHVVGIRRTNVDRIRAVSDRSSRIPTRPEILITELGVGYRLTV